MEEQTQATATDETTTTEPKETEKTKDKKSRTQPIRFTEQQTTLEDKKLAIAEKIKDLQNYRRRLIRNDEANKTGIPAKKQEARRLCALARTVEKLEGREYSLEEVKTVFEPYYQGLLEKKTSATEQNQDKLRWQHIGRLVELAAKRKITDIDAFYKYICGQAEGGWLKG